MLVCPFSSVYFQRFIGVAIYIKEYKETEDIHIKGGDLAHVGFSPYNPGLGEAFGDYGPMRLLRPDIRVDNGQPSESITTNIEPECFDCPHVIR
jgi:hypothetical protein